jgi:hypothetical protein
MMNIERLFVLAASGGTQEARREGERQLRRQRVVFGGLQARRERRAFKLVR